MHRSTAAIHLSQSESRARIRLIGKIQSIISQRALKIVFRHQRSRSHHTPSTERSCHIIVCLILMISLSIIFYFFLAPAVAAAAVISI